MQSGSLWVVFNGEIYNFPELRHDLERLGCQFRSHSDTEVLLHGYRTWGSGLCARLEGMFAFAIYDEASDRTLCGARPCGSEAAALRRCRWLLHRRFGDQGDSLARRAQASDAAGVISRLSGLRLRARAIYLVQRCPLHPARPLHGDIAIPAIESRSGKRGIWNYLPPVDPPNVTKADALELIDEQIQRSVKSHLLSDVEVGALLSGGVDSGSIVATASRLTESPLRTFTIGFGSSDEDELPLARLVADRYKTRHHEEIVRESDFKSSVDGVLDIFDQPFADTSLVPTLAVSSVAAKSVKVVLTGDGGDEVFGGYNFGRYISPIRGPRPWQTMRLDGGFANELLRFFEDCLFYVCMPEARWNARNHYPKYVRSARRQLRLMPMELRRQLQNYEYRWMYPPHTVDGLDAFRQAQWHLIKHILPGRMLAKMDRCSMQHSIEARAPFLSHKLIESMLNLPTSIKNPPARWFKGLLQGMGFRSPPIEDPELPQAWLRGPKELERPSQFGSRHAGRVPHGWTRTHFDRCRRRLAP